MECEVFAERCPKEWAKYLNRNKDKTAKYLNKFYRCEMCLAAVQNDVDTFAYLELCMDNDWKIFQLPEYERPKEEIRLYEQWLSYEELEETEEDNLYIRQIEALDDIEQSFRESYIEAILPEHPEDAEAWISCSDYPEIVREELKKGYQEWDVFWNEFYSDTYSLQFLAEFCSWRGHLSGSIFDKISDIAAYMEEKCQLKSDEAAKLFLALCRPEQTVWSEKELEEISFELFESDNLKADLLVEAKILVRSDSWYRVTNDFVLFAGFMTELQKKSRKEKIGWYRNIFLCGDGSEAGCIKKQREWIINEYCNRGAISVVCQMNPEIMYEAVLPVLAEQLYEQLQGGSEQETIEHMIEWLGMSVNIEADGSVSGGTVCGDDLFDLLDIMERVFLFDVFPEELTKEQMKLLLEKDILPEPGEELTFGALQEKGLLQMLGIYENLLKVWKMICFWKERGTEHGCE